MVKRTLMGQEVPGKGNCSQENGCCSFVSVTGSLERDRAGSSRNLWWTITWQAERDSFTPYGNCLAGCFACCEASLDEAIRNGVSADTKNAPFLGDRPK